MRESSLLISILLLLVFVYFKFAISILLHFETFVVRYQAQMELELAFMNSVILNFFENNFLLLKNKKKQKKRDMCILLVLHHYILYIRMLNDITNYPIFFSRFCIVATKFDPSSENEHRLLTTVSFILRASSAPKIASIVGKTLVGILNRRNSDNEVDDNDDDDDADSEVVAVESFLNEEASESCSLLVAS